MQYDHVAIEKKWQERWNAERAWATSTDRTRQKYYVLDMFPYPSGSGLHVGHPKGYVATDVVARIRRSMGFNVLRVMGWDSFGLPAERQAEREGKHPKEITVRNVAVFKSQLQRLGLAYDWDRELATSDVRYYKWTQWIFARLYERGLAYRAEVPVNWCPALGTVLANEEVHDGHAVETGDPVEKRLMTQWMFRITAYAETLVQALELVDWPEGIKKQQRDWIGRSEGAEVTFEVAHGAVVDGAPAKFTVFTTRPDTLFGCTYAVLAPEHALVDAITTTDRAQAVAAYRAEAGKRSDRDRMAQAADAPKSGCWTGAWAVCPVNGERVPVWIADYVLAGYGTGAVFACPAHDERDWAFAQTHGLPIREVVQGGDVMAAPYTGDGPHVNSGFLDGLDAAAAKKAVVTWLETRGAGKGMVQYRLRDWLFSRQRYWGEPFPIVLGDDGSVKLVPDAQLPVELPAIADYRPTPDGRPPLARDAAWVRTAGGQRETNTMPQWAGSCWYYLRFISPDRDDVAWDAADEKYWMPVDLYVGGAEHAVLHLLYARFWHHVLYDMGLVSTPEPFHRLVNQGMIHAHSYQDAGKKYYYPSQVEERDGRWFVIGTDTPVERKLEKMAKSKYNVENPDDMCDRYGADALRLYELFMGPLEDSAFWETSGVAGTRRFLDRSWRLIVDENGGRSPKIVDGPVDDRALERALHAAIKKVRECADNMRFNTAISEMMIFVNEATRAERVPAAWAAMFVQILAPFAPHLACELWAALGRTELLFDVPFPAFDEAKLATDTIAIAVQVNGKLRGEVHLPKDVAKDAAIAAARSEPSVARYLEGVAIKREIYVPGRLVNLVVG
jgi:leucyl-tRNA synthetase